MTEEQLKAKSNAILDKLEEGGFDLDDWSIEDAHNNGFIDGYHECQKEHEWHYVKDGYLPKGEHTESEKVYAIFKNNSYYIVDRAAVKNYDDLIAWIELPKLPKEE